MKEERHQLTESITFRPTRTETYLLPTTYLSSQYIRGLQFVPQQKLYRCTLYQYNMKLSLAATFALAATTDAFTVAPRTIQSKTIPSATLPKTALLASPKSDDNNTFDLFNNDVISQVGKGIASAMIALTISFNTFGPLQSVEPAFASDGKAIGLCLLQKCRLPLAKCITNPNCLANVICINTCNGKEDETGCQIKCGDIFENTAVGEFNKCAVSDMDCVPTRADDGSYPVPADDVIVPKFNTNLFNGKWYITAGQNELFDRFPCQVHFFTETEPGKFFGKLNWRIQEPDGEFFTRDAVQEFYQDPKQPGHLINHDNDYLHYEDDWFIIDYAEDGNKDGVPPFAFVYYRGANDAWVGYGGAVVYTRDSKLPTELIPRLREAAKKVNFDYDKDFKANDNTCTEMSNGEKILLREQFAGKGAIQTEEQIQAAMINARGNAVNVVKTDVKTAETAFEELEKKAFNFEKEVVKDVVSPLEKIEKEIEKDVIEVEKKIVEEVEEVEKDIVGIFKKK
jgi:violaxanthin de-epoxidase